MNETNTLLVSEEKYDQLLRESEALRTIIRLIDGEKDFCDITAIKKVLGIGGATNVH